MSNLQEIVRLTSSDSSEDTKKRLKDTDSESSDEPRQTWDRKAEFILALLGYSVGLGNVWRFSYLCYKNGGGAFLIPYAIFVIIAGIPMFFLEISIGQFTRQTPLGVWKLVPSMKGIGYGSAVINALCGIYYIMVMAWSALYLVHSCLPGPLPWTTCGEEVDTKQLLQELSIQTLRVDLSGAVEFNESLTSPTANPMMRGI